MKEKRINGLYPDGSIFNTKIVENKNISDYNFEEIDNQYNSYRHFIYFKVLFRKLNYIDSDGTTINAGYDNGLSSNDRDQVVQKAEDDKVLQDMAFIFKLTFHD